jgi:DNA helicase IV
MKLKSSLVAALLGRNRGPRVELVGDHLVLQHRHETRRISLRAVHDVVVIREGFWTDVKLETADASWVVPGTSRSSAKGFREQVIRKISTDGKAALKAIEPGLLIDAIDALFARDRYLARHDVREWCSDLGATNPAVAVAMEFLRHPLFSKNMAIKDVPQAGRRLHDLIVGPFQELRIRNERHVDQELVRLREFFASVESRPLTEEQARAAIVGEDRNLVIAAAGSGKTSVVVARIGYAIKNQACHPHEVLALAFNRTAADELKARISQRLGDGAPGVGEIQAITFHKLGLEIIAEAESRKPSLAPWVSETSDNSGAIIQELAVDLVRRDAGFAARWMLFRVLASKPHEPIARFATREDYDRYLIQVGEDRDGHKGIRTLNGELVKSMEEVAIANWLFISGVPYVYERGYEYQTADREHRQYHPDFYYPDIDLYHEHFALDEKGRPPAVFSEKYADGVQWKRVLHAAKKTNLIETTSSQFRDGSALAKLEEALRSRGQTFKPRDPQDIEDRLSELQVPKFEGLFRSVIALAKANGLGPAALGRLASEQGDRFRARLFADVALPLFEAYEARLQALKCIDFEDMIWRAVSHLQAGRYTHPFKLILVDEFQDISKSRSELVKAMLHQSPGAKLFAVGDDWQSIYRFAGADQSLMTNFEAEYGPTATSFLTTTFRSNQGISDTASAFIQRNPAQIAKRVRSVDARRASTIHVLEYARDEDVDTFVVAELRALALKAPARTRKASVRILARFNHLRPRSFLDWQKKFADNLDLQFLTLHRAKGLEADYVFILGCNIGMYGLPSSIEDDPLLGMVLPRAEPFAHAEERRLFYVGLTRARHRCHVLTRRGLSSPFVRELVGSDEAVVYRVGHPRPAPVRATPCPDCEYGILREVQHDGQSEERCSNGPQCAPRKPKPSSETSGPHSGTGRSVKGVERMQTGRSTSRRPTRN